MQAVDTADTEPVGRRGHRVVHRRRRSHCRCWRLGGSQRLRHHKCRRRRCDPPSLQHRQWLLCRQWSTPTEIGDQPFRIRGVNPLHWDSNSAAGIQKSGANAVRWDIDFTRAATDNVDLIQTQTIQDGEAPIVGNWTGTCSTDPSALSSIVSTWVAQAAQWTTLNEYLIVDIANEWGPPIAPCGAIPISAPSRAAQAGYTGPILIDSGGCGQDDADLLQYSQAVFDSDPQRNVMFNPSVLRRQ